jgi:ribonuclease HI
MITIATDGSCIGNPGPGAYGFVVDHDSSIRERAIPVAATTVGEMEVRALLEALLYTSADLPMSPVRIICDSQYVVNGYNEWMAGWETKGWHKKGGLAHAALWKDIAAMKRRIGNRVTVEWIRAHQNIGGLNDKVDALVNSAARSQRAVNGPALQASVAEAPAPAAFAGPMPLVDQSKPGGNLYVAKPTYEELVALLKESRDMIDTLATDHSGAVELSEQIGDTLDRI